MRTLLLYVCAGAVVLIAAPAGTYTETVLHNFLPGMPEGIAPNGPVIRDAAGALYGTTVGGGLYGAGTVFRIGVDGRESVLYSFTGGADGGGPYGGVVADAAGNLYGTTATGGNLATSCVDGPVYGCGVVFKLDPSGKETVLYTFLDGNDGGFPTASLTLDPAGNLYGTALKQNNSGVVFKVTPAGNETVLYSFANGVMPSSSLLRDSAGNLYGTAIFSGEQGGEVFRVNPNGQEKVLYTFTGGSDGGLPEGGLVADPSGNLYGTAAHGGNCSESVGCGVVFKLSPSGMESVLYDFVGGTDGEFPAGNLARDSFGNLYGTTATGGGNDQCSPGTGCGTVFEIAATGQETVLYAFTGQADGGSPQSGVILDASGSLYGTTSTGSDGFFGTVFAVRDGTESTVFGFPEGTDGSQPWAGVTLDPSGNLYGTTLYGGAFNSGAVYKENPAGRETVLYSFVNPVLIGEIAGSPSGGVTIDAAGNLYGAVSEPYPYTAGHGWLYKIDASGNQSVVYMFAGGASGSQPTGTLTLDSGGNIYGTTHQGGKSTVGVVFKVSPDGQETVLHEFTGAPDGGNPMGGLVRDAAGVLYGTTPHGGAANNGPGCGVVFKLAPNGQETILHTFTGPDGCGPQPDLVSDAAGNLYGTTLNGGVVAGPADGCGVVFKLDPAGNESVLHAFTCGADGAEPTGGLVRDPAGNLYGTTTLGGSGTSGDGYGVVFEIDPSGNTTVLYTFTGGEDGGRPEAGVTRDSAGNLFGTAPMGGANLSGVLFKLTPL